MSLINIEAQVKQYKFGLQKFWNLDLKGEHWAD